MTSRFTFRGPFIYSELRILWRNCFEPSHPLSRPTQVFGTKHISPVTGGNHPELSSLATCGPLEDFLHTSQGGDSCSSLEGSLTLLELQALAFREGHAPPFPGWLQAGVTAAQHTPVRSHPGLRAPLGYAGFLCSGRRGAANASAPCRDSRAGSPCRVTGRACPAPPPQAPPRQPAHCLRF